MKFIVVTDVHFYYNPRKSYIDSDGENSWFKIQKSILMSIFDFVVNNNIPLIIFNGDLFEEKFRINQSLYNEVWRLFYEFHSSNPDIKLIFNLGNHDIIKSDPIETSLYTFSFFAELIQKPISKFDLFTIVPYGCSIPKNDTNKILFTHTKYEGLVHGITNYEFKVSDGATTIKSVDRYDIVFNGHIHHPQKINNIINIGSPMIDDWGTADDKDHGFIYYNNGNIEFIKTQYPSFIKVKKLNDKLRNRITNNNYDFFRIDVSKEELSDDIFKKYNVIPYITKYKKRKERIKKSLSEIDIIKEYVGHSDTELNKDNLIDIGERLIC